MIAATLPTATRSSLLRLAPLWMLPSRLVLGALVQLLVVMLFLLRGHPDPWEAARPWWTVSGSLIDVGSLWLLTMLARSEGSRLVEWIHLGPFRSELKGSLAAVPLLLVLGVSGGVAAGVLVYGAPQPAPMGGLPLSAALYSAFVWPVLWAFSEELTYNGYIAPRLEKLSGSRALTIGFVAIWWAVQHIVLPMKLDASFMLYRSLSALPVALGATALFLRTRRLFPLIVGHWVANMLAALTAVLWPVLQGS